MNDFKSLSEAMKGKAKLSSTDSESSLTKSPPGLIFSGDNSHTNGMQKKVNLAGPGVVNPIRKKRRKPLVGNEKDRRPMNGFMLFAKSMRVELTKEYPGKDNR